MAGKYHTLPNTAVGNVMSVCSEYGFACANRVVDSAKRALPPRQPVQEFSKMSLGRLIITRNDCCAAVHF